MEPKTSNPLTRFLDPKKIIDQLIIEKGSVAADFGCASGYFSLPFAEAIGEEGLLYALDVLPQALEKVESSAKENGLSNIKTKRVNLENDNGSGLGSDSCDWVIIKDMLFQNNNKDMIIKEALRVLKKDGKALIIEWNEAVSSVGPEKSLRIPRENLKEIVIKEGFNIEEEVDAGGFHYGFVARK